MKILVVGGLGFLGKKCLEKLDKLEVTVVGRKQPDMPLPGSKHTYSQLDISDDDKVRKFLKTNSYSHLLYLAWPSSPPHNDMRHIKFAYDTIKFIGYFGEAQPDSRIIMTGSIHEAEISNGLIPDEITGSSPSTLYGISKKYVYTCLKKILSESFPEISFCWARLSNVYGPQDYSEKLISQIISSTIKQEDFNLLFPNNIVDFLYIQDAVDGVVAALFSSFKGAINIGSGTGIRLSVVKDIVYNLVRENFPKQVDYNATYEEIMACGSILDIAQANKILGYKPKVFFVQGIKECIYATETKHSAIH